MADDDLHDFERSSFTHGGKTRTIFRQGTGPAVIVIAEIPGITPKVADFARKVSAIGCTAIMPHLFGDPGHEPGGSGKVGIRDVGTMLKVFGPLCVSKEFTIMAVGKTSPVVEWLRALAAAEHETCGGPGVGAVGMCFTGGYALAMATDDRLLAPVLSQPSMPFTIGKKQRRGIDISRADLDTVKHRCETQGLEVLGLRFKSDKLVSDERFAFLRDELGDAFIAVELEDEAANPAGVMRPHSVLTEHLIDGPGEPTRAALDQVLDLFRDRLLTSA